MKNLLLLTFIAISFVNYSQNNWCGFDQQLQKHYQENPNAEAQVYERFDRIASGQINAQDRVGPYYIPVVVHVIHDGEEGNISYAQIADAINMLNEDFNRTNVDASNTRNTVNAPFSPVAADLEINFVLAKLDPNGNCTNGVERRDSPLGTYNADDDSKTYNGGGLDAWDRNKYFNIWVVNSIQGSGAGTTLGYAQFPMWGGASTYGVIIRNNAFGNIGTANGDRTISHEVGHCLGLFHTFQSGCGSSNSDCSNQGDGCCDTPPVDEAHWSCSNNQNNCSQIPNGDHFGFDALDQHENFMSYSPCQNMFSEDQKAVVTANLANLGHLANLVSVSSQNSSGINLPDVLCRAEFSGSQLIVCAGSTINFADNSFHNVSTRSWTFTGGTPSVSTDSFASIMYNTPGVYPVSLQVSDGTNTESETKAAYITVLSNPGLELPYSEGFETVSLPDNINFFVYNEDNGSEWTVTNSASSTGDKSIMLSNYGENVDLIDEFHSGTIDLSPLDSTENLIMSFKYAYNKRLASNYEALKVWVSKDCGENWSLRKNLTNSVFNTNLIGAASSSPFTPTSKMEWITVSFENIHSSFYTSNFRYRFSFESDNGNNIFIDDINLYPESWLNNPENNIENTVSIFPNPTQNNSTINYFSATSEDLNITLYNVVGEKINTIYNGTVSSGNTQYDVNMEEMPRGIYIVKIENSNGIKSLKLIKD